MRSDADAHADEDKQKRELAEQRNQADSMCWQLEKLLKEHDAKLNAADKEAVSKAIEKTREAAKGDDLDRDQVGGPRVGAGLARPEQDALREGRPRRRAGAAHARRWRCQARPLGRDPRRRGRRRRCGVRSERVRRCPRLGGGWASARKPRRPATQATRVMSAQAYEMAIDRVTHRVEQGGHDIPADVIRRRF